MSTDRRVPRRVVRVVLTAVLAAATITACGDDPPEVSVTFDPAETTTPATTDPAATDPATTDPATTDPATTASSAPTTDTGPASTTAPTAAPTTAPTTETTAPPEATVRANVYWAWSIPTSVGTPERLGAGSRSVPADDPLTGAVAALLDGPNEAETEVGMGTAIPAGTTVLDVDVDDRVARVDLDDTFTESSGTLAETTRLAQVVFTLTAFDDVDAVTFSIDGEPQDPILSHGFVVGDGLDRDDFAEVRPFVLVEAPTPGEVVDGDELTVRGESNTFEGTVQWELLDGDGVAVEEGFTTATGGMGTWGEFAFTVDLDAIDGDDRDDEDDDLDRGSIVVFETSARDGSRQNVVEVPFVVN